MSTRRKKRKIIYILIVVVIAILVTLLLPKKYFINYDGEEFTPQGLTIKLGDSVSVKNNSKAYMEFAIGSHENHRTLKGFEEKIIEANATYTFTPREKGIFDFHNHLNPKKIGVLIINE